MAKWKDRSTGYTNPEIKSSEIELGKFRLRVHRHIACSPDKWLATCHPGLFDTIMLESKELSKAKLQAISKVKTLLDDAIKDILQN